MFVPTYTHQHRSPMRIRLLVPAAAFSLALAAPARAGASDGARGRVIVRYDRSATHADRLAVEDATGTGSAVTLPGGKNALRLEDGYAASETPHELRPEPDVDYAVPDYRLDAAAAAYFPNDP